MKMLGLLVCLISSPGLAAEAVAEMLLEHHSYLQTIGSESTQLDWRLLEAQPLKVRTSLGHEVDLTSVDASFSTWLWELSDHNIGTELRVERRGNALEISGSFRGEVINRQLAIDDAPWFQTLSLSLRAFLNGSQKMIEFWCLRPASLKVYKLRAVKKGSEAIAVPHGTVHADRVEIRLAGVGGFLWKADYWFRRNDAVFLRYVGPSGPPGSPNTIVTLR
ncbi:MAG: hypothetical protein P1P74_05270 [Desulfuromonadales bacterium]|nr:hypothetical protein [Desulfuromonadales bacterium]